MELLQHAAGRRRRLRRLSGTADVSALSENGGRIFQAALFAKNRGSAGILVGGVALEKRGGARNALQTHARGAVEDAGRSRTDLREEPKQDSGSGEALQADQNDRRGIVELDGRGRQRRHL